MPNCSDLELQITSVLQIQLSILFCSILVTVLSIAVFQKVVLCRIHFTGVRVSVCSTVRTLTFSLQVMVRKMLLHFTHLTSFGHLMHDFQPMLELFYNIFDWKCHKN